MSVLFANDNRISSIFDEFIRSQAGYLSYFDARITPTRMPSETFLAFCKPNAVRGTT